MKFIKIIGVIVFLLSLGISQPSFASSNKVAEWVKPSQSSGKIQKFVFVPIKKSSNLSVSNEKIAQELGYYFYKLGFDGSPAGFALFEGKEYFEINSSVHRNLTENNLNLNVYIVFLVYKNDFKVENFGEAIELFSATEMRDIIAITTIKSKEEVEIRNVEVIKNDKKYYLKFSDTLDQTSKLQSYLKTDFANKTPVDLKFDSVAMSGEADPNAIFDVKFNLKNNSGLDTAFDKSNPITIRFENDSRYFVSNVWANTRTTVLLQNNFIEGLSSKSFVSKFRSPLLPGDYKDNVSLYLGEQKLDQTSFAFKVKDTGQKVLRVKNVLLGLSVRKDATTNSDEISKVATGAEFIFTEEKNGFVKITLQDGKTGWVSTNYIDVIKK